MRAIDKPKRIAAARVAVRQWFKSNLRPAVRWLGGALLVITATWVVSIAPAPIRESLVPVGSLALLAATAVYVRHMRDTVELQRVALARSHNAERMAALSAAEEATFAAISAFLAFPDLKWLAREPLSPHVADYPRRAELLAGNLKKLSGTAVAVSRAAPALEPPLNVEMQTLSRMLTEGLEVALELINFEQHMMFVAQKGDLTKPLGNAKVERAWNAVQELKTSAGALGKWSDYEARDRIPIVSEIHKCVSRLLGEIAIARLSVRP